MAEMDMGIKYNSKLNEVRETIKKLQELSFNLERIIIKVDDIDKELKEGIKSTYASYSTSTQHLFLNEKLVMMYDDAINKLERINDSLKREYSNYYKLYVLSKKLVDKINNVDESNIDIVVASALLILKLLKASSTIDYEIEEKIVNNIYKIIYDVLKLEAIYSKNSKLLEMIKLSDIDSQYIVCLIKKDISIIGDNSEIKNVISNMDVVELDDKYLLDSNLISLIALSTNSKLKEKAIDILLKKVSLYENLLTDLENKEKEKKNTTSLIDNTLDIRKANKANAMKKKMILAVNAVVVTSVLFGGSIAIKHLAKQIKYKTTVTTYDSYNDSFTVKENYEGGKDESINITEYSPWDSPGYFRDKYVRNVYKYSGFENLVVDYSDASKYLNSNLKEGLLWNSNIEEVKGIPEDYGYGENKYIVVEVKKDLEDYIVEELDFPLLLLLYGCLYLGVFTIDSIFMSKVIKKLKQLIRKIKQVNVDLKEYKGKLSDNRKTIEELKIQIDEIKNLIIKEYEKLPDIIKESKEIEVVKKLELTSK